MDLSTITHQFSLTCGESGGHTPAGFLHQAKWRRLQIAGIICMDRRPLFCRDDLVAKTGAGKSLDEIVQLLNGFLRKARWPRVHPDSQRGHDQHQSQDHNFFVIGISLFYPR